MPYLCCVERQTAAPPIGALKPTAVKVKPLLKMRNLSEVFSKFDGVQTKGMNKAAGLAIYDAWQQEYQTIKCMVEVPNASTFEEAVSYLKREMVAHGIHGQFKFLKAIKPDAWWSYDDRDYHYGCGDDNDHPNRVTVKRDSKGWTI